VKCLRGRANYYILILNIEDIQVTCTDELFKIRTVNRVMLTIFVPSTEICGAESVEQMTRHEDRNNTQPSENNNQQFIIYKHILN